MDRMLDECAPSETVINKERSGCAADVGVGDAFLEIGAPGSLPTLALTGGEGEGECVVLLGTVLLPLLLSVRFSKTSKVMDEK